MATYIHVSGGGPDRRSKNLRGLLDHARRVDPIAASLVENAPGAKAPYELTVYFANHDAAFSDWQDWRVAARWLAARRSWPALMVRGFEPFCKEYMRQRHGVAQ